MSLFCNAPGLPSSDRDNAVNSAAKVAETYSCLRSHFAAVSYQAGQSAAAQDGRETPFSCHAVAVAQLQLSSSCTGTTWQFLQLQMRQLVQAAVVAFCSFFFLIGEEIKEEIC